MKLRIGKKDKNTKNKGVVLEVTQEQYDEQRSEGFEDEEILPPGKHIFRSVPKRRLAAGADLHPSNTKVQITMKIDLDVLNYFKERSEKTHAAPYQTQINAELRAIMERDQVQPSQEVEETAKELLKNDEFLKALSKKLKEKKLIPA